MIINKQQNSSSNRIILPTPLGFSQKAGIFFAKQKRTKQLDEQNKQLQQQIRKVLGQYETKNQIYNQLKLKQCTLQNMNTILIVQNENLLKENSKVKQFIQSFEKEHIQLKSQQVFYSQQVIQKQKDLFQNIKIKQEQQNYLQRQKDELKNQKTFRYAPNSIVNVVNQMQKEYQLLQRNIKVHQNKLQSKNKYLGILQKKQQKQKHKQDQIQKKLQSQKKIVLNIYERPVQKKITNIKKTVDKQKQSQSLRALNKQKQKKFDDLNRKKNSIMLNSKKN